MASINSDIRVRSNNMGRFTAIILGVAALALSIAFGISLIPAQANAAGHNFHWGGFHVSHGHHYNVHNHNYHHVGHHHNHHDDDEDESETGTLNISIVVDNTSGTGAATVDDFAANVYENGSETPTANSPFMDGDSTDIDEGTTYTVELDALQDGYDVTYSEGCSGTMDEDDEVTCTITNTAVVPVVVPSTPVAQSFVVRAADLAANLGDVITTPTKWFFYNDETDVIDNALGSFVTGPSTAPLGTGSAQISVTGTERRNIATYQFKSIKLANITALSFSTYSQSVGNPGSTARAPYLNFNVSFDGADSWQRRLAFVPNLNGTVTPDTWQNWNAAASTGLWVYSGAFWPAGVTTIANTTPGTTARTLASLITDYPNIQTRASDSWFGFRVGEPYNDGFTGNVDNFVITTDDGVTATTTTVDFEPTTAPVDPTCNENQHLDNHVCVANQVTETPSSAGSNGNGGGNGGGGVIGNGPYSLGYVQTNNGGGQVLGASTDAPSCGTYLTSYLKFGGKNNAEQVKKLQTFLNTHEGAKLEVNGIFDQATFAAVKAFQVAHFKDVLTPWLPHGLQNDHAATGYVYKTTLRMINLINCSTLNIPVPQLP